MITFAERVDRALSNAKVAWASFLLGYVDALIDSMTREERAAMFNALARAGRIPRNPL